MLSPLSYALALTAYILSALVGLHFICVFFYSKAHTLTATVLTGVTAALLLTPAFTASGAETLAPALIVALFTSVIGEGFVAARPAINTLVLGVLFSVCVSLLGRAVWIQLKR